MFWPGGGKAICPDNGYEPLQGRRGEPEPMVPAQRVDKVYTVSSGMGFEAVLAGRHVICFGSPFYAGWGFTMTAASR
jgi:hypothetical protein